MRGLWQGSVQARVGWGGGRAGGGRSQQQPLCNPVPHKLATVDLSGPIGAQGVGKSKIARDSAAAPCAPASP